MVKAHQNITGPYGVLSLVPSDNGLVVYLPIVDYDQLLLGTDKKVIAYQNANKCMAFLDSLEALASSGSIQMTYKTLTVKEYLKRPQVAPEQGKEPLKQPKVSTLAKFDLEPPAVSPLLPKKLRDQALRLSLGSDPQPVADFDKAVNQLLKKPR